jgi:hypothetical protein
VTGLELYVVNLAWGIAEWKLGYVEQAVSRWEETAVTARAAGDERTVAIVLINLGNVSLEQRDFARARGYFEESASISRRLDLKPALANSLVDLGFASLAEADVQEAGASFRESVAVCSAEGSVETMVWAVEGLAAVAAARGRAADATRLLAATGRAKADLAIAEDFYPIGSEARDRTTAAARRQLGDLAFTAAWAVGEQLSMEQAAESAASIE